MQLYLVRHGIAQESSLGVDDGERALTAEGRKKLKGIFESAVNAGVKPTLILSSPLKRALQTADMGRQILSYSQDIVQTDALLPGSTATHVWDEIRTHRDEESLMLVGHNPLLSESAGYLLGCLELQIEFKKGAIMRIDFDHFLSEPLGTLQWYVTPRLVSERP